MKKNKVIIVGAMYSLNYGDGIICKTVSNIIEKEFGYENIIFGISGKDKYPEDLNLNNKKGIKNKISKIFPVNKYIMIRSRKKLKIKLKNLNPNEYKALIFAGGQLFMNCFIDYINEIVKWADTMNIPVYFNCCGMGKISFSNKIKLYKCLKKKNIKGITIRDGLEDFKREFKIKNTYKVYDPVIEISKYYIPNIRKKKKLGVGIIHPINFRKNCVNIDKNQYNQIINMIVSYCKKNNIEFEFFTNGDIMDYQYCTYLARKNNCENLVVNRPDSPEKLIDIICKYENIISCRLHSLIIAAAYGIPVSALIWDLKVKEFMSNIEREEYAISMLKLPTLETVEYNIKQLLEKNFVYKYEKFPLTSKSLSAFINIL